MDTTSLRSQLAALGDIPEGLLDVVGVVAGSLLERHAELLALDLGDCEPFCPARRLPDDAA